MRLTLFLLFSIFTLLNAKESKIELGAGLASLSYPNYVGSKTYNLIALPLPYLRYRGDFLTLDKDGLKGKLFGLKELRLELSVSGSLPASSDKGSARDGMPDLELSGEAGLQLVYRFYEKEVSKLEFEFPIRAVLSTDFSEVQYIGLTSNPQLRYSLNYTHFEWTLRSGIILGDENYNSYYYGVEQKYVTSTRSQYEAKAGFNGWRNRVGVTYKKGSWWAGAFISYINLNGSVIEDSPLVETTSALYSGTSVAYIFYTSD